MKKNKKKKIADLIEKQYGSQSKFAAAAGLDASTVSAIVTGHLRPYPAQVEKIVEALGWTGSVDDLLGK